ncbi:1,3,6,8-tetrahydroxynaphthalene synthase [Lentibacillus sp. JNUCC-1]|uniref:type III polyketide synthase n=1 Tax=Lentibacillus sp. JNUCC-1 TaxID=2654513 RepID=UPI0012E78D9D|nr:3-oxoacyl-[acyl-carrier-protein] synthase III C-terminal domain-containing protein [Lentibacillus sp. JNUCC-1]MUV39817.1 1,3,6,8-tetrahydroxynaphthalene synthase [Lentibacillus sp. JNUCC-1]
MAFIGSVGIGLPDHHISQDEAKQLASSLFSNKIADTDRLLAVFDHAAIEDRQLVVDLDWFAQDHRLKERNDMYTQSVLKHTLTALDETLAAGTFLSKNVPYEAIDLIVFVSSTGLSTPSIDAHLINSRPIREDVARMPLWGFGCAGGAIGLAHAHDWLQAYPDKNAIVICAETASLTFQHQDTNPSNLIGTALFGDGMAAALLMGKESKYLNHLMKTIPKIAKRGSHTAKNTLDVMGWDVVDSGFEVVFSKQIPSLVESVWKSHVEQFTSEVSLHPSDIHSYIAHPGGRKVLEAMESVFNIPRFKLQPSWDILRNHGNMSSPTVLYALEKWMQSTVEAGEKSILSALGPGFSSELMSLEWV